MLERERERENEQGEMDMREKQMIDVKERKKLDDIIGFINLIVNF